jgi:hypothetical protein
MNLINITSIVLVVAGMLYQAKYAIQFLKIRRLGTSKGVARTYFWISIIYETVCTIGSILLHNWMLFVLSILPLIGNITVFLVAVKYAPFSNKKDWKHRMYKWLQKLI